MMNADRYVVYVDSFTHLIRTHSHTRYSLSITSGWDEARPCEHGGVLADRRCSLANWRREREGGREKLGKKKGERERERREEADEVSMCLSRGMTQQEKETEEKSPEQLSQLRGPSLDRETEKWTDRQRRDMCGCHPAISYAQRERQKGGDGSSREASGWGLEA